jgi:membrane protease YdiL (CAAX protease family)
MHSARSFRIVLIVLWIVGAIAACFYSQVNHIPASVAIPAALAFLVELSLYASLGHIRYSQPPVLAASGLASYLIYSIPCGVFQPKLFLLLCALTLVAAYWLPRLPRSLDFAFLAFMGGVYLFKVIRVPYVEPYPDLRADALGQLMWFRLGLAAVLSFRYDERMGFGFLPRAREWRTGLVHFALMAPVAAAAAWAIGFAELRLTPGYWWKAPATFFGILWVVALAEETFFRGILLQRLVDRLGVPAALAISSAAFGAVHLWYANAFPNWKFALMAALAGVFYSSAYLAGPGIRSSMVTHALTVTVLKTLLRVTGL